MFEVWIRYRNGQEVLWCRSDDPVKDGAELMNCLGRDVASGFRVTASFEWPQEQITTVEHSKIEEDKVETFQGEVTV